MKTTKLYATFCFLAIFTLSICFNYSFSQTLIQRHSAENNSQTPDKTSPHTTDEHSPPVHVKSENSLKNENYQKLIEKHDGALSETPPTPLNRPDSFKPSQDYIEQLLEEAGDQSDTTPPETKNSANKPNDKRIKVRPTISKSRNTYTSVPPDPRMAQMISSDKLAKKLRSPQALDILSSIDPDAGRALQMSLIDKQKPPHEPLENNIRRIHASNMDKSDITNSNQLKLPFISGKATLENPNDLDTLFITALKHQASGTLQTIELQGFASRNKNGSELSPSDTRRLSLARALTIRDWLSQSKIDPRKIIVRGLGENSQTSDKKSGDSLDTETSNSLDRVDILFVHNK